MGLYSSHFTASTTTLAPPDSLAPSFSMLRLQAREKAGTLLAGSGALTQKAE